MKAFCTICGRAVPIRLRLDGSAEYLKCRVHPEAPRRKSLKSLFESLRATVEAVKDSPGRVYRGGANYWSVLESRAAAGRVGRMAAVCGALLLAVSLSGCVDDGTDGGGKDRPIHKHPPIRKWGDL